MKHKILALIILIFFLNSGLEAQLGLGSGRIKGIIFDENGQPIAGAEVDVLNLAYGTKFTTTSDEKGRWGVTGLASGWYRVTVRKEGFEEATLEFQLSLVAQKVHELDVKLRKQKVATTHGLPESKGLALAALLKEGNELYNQQQYPEALAKFAEFIKEHPKTYQVYVNIGNCLLAMKEYNRAIEAYTAFLDRARSEKGSLKDDQEAAMVLATIGKIHLDLKSVDKAKEYFEQAIDTYPSDKILAFNVGEIYFNQGKPEQAIDYLSKAIKIDEKWAPPYLKIGYAYLNRGLYKKALENFVKFLELSPDDPQAGSVKEILPEIEKLAKKEKEN